MRQITNCSYCNEPLDEDEKEIFTNVTDEMPLCLECLIKIV